MTKKLTTTLIKKISNVPGLAGLSPIDFARKKRVLSKDELTKGISAEETPKGLLIRIAIFVNIDIRSKLVVQEINSSVKSIFKTEDIKLSKVLIYVMGVK